MIHNFKQGDRVRTDSGVLSDSIGLITYAPAADALVIRVDFDGGMFSLIPVDLLVKIEGEEPADLPER